MMGLFLQGLLSLAWASKPADPALYSSFSISPQPLRTEEVWTLVPGELNPHLARSALNRELEINGLESKLLKNGQFSAAAAVVRAVTTLHLRGSGMGGQWYQEVSQFGCEKKPNSWFWTETGTRVHGEEAARIWHQLIDEERLKLGFLLSKISEPKAAQALIRAGRIIDFWRAGLELLWNQKQEQARTQEWKTYLESAENIGLCPNSSRIARAPSWRRKLEPPLEQPRTQLIARLPSRLWEGLYTVRASVSFGNKVLNGRFLIDSGSATSMVSPDWLKAQGVHPGLDPGPFAFNLGGQTVSLSELKIKQTDLFQPPNFFGTCCDGILGADLLRLFVVEFIPRPGPAVLLYQRAGFSLGQSAPWVDLELLPQGPPRSSDCEFTLGSKKISSVGWRTGSSSTVQLHSSLSKNTAKETGKLRCGTFEFTSDLKIDATQDAGPSDVSIGMGLLGRAGFTLDLAHGRLWLTRKLLTEPARINRSGLEVEFRYQSSSSAERVLAVKKVSSTQLEIKRGDLIDTIDGFPASEMDQWEVNQRLSGSYGPKVDLKWRRGNLLQFGQIKFQ